VLGELDRLVAAFAVEVGGRCEVRRLAILECEQAVRGVDDERVAERVRVTLGLDDLEARQLGEPAIQRAAVGRVVAEQRRDSVAAEPLAEHARGAQHPAQLRRQRGDT
jgi:hypothetical protein